MTSPPFLLLQKTAFSSILILTVNRSVASSDPHPDDGENRPSMRMRLCILAVL
jgi:hypothetical protein